MRNLAVWRNPSGPRGPGPATIEPAFLVGDVVSVEALMGDVKLDAAIAVQTDSSVRVRLSGQERGQRLPLRHGAELLIIFDRFGSRFAHEARFVSVDSDRIPPELVLQLTADAPQRIERVRSSFRLAVALKAEYQVIAADGPGPARDGKLLDLSAGGAALELERRQPAPPVGARLRVRFGLGGTETTVSALARVTRRSAQGYGGAIGLQFHSLDEPTQEAIVRWIFAEQRRRAVL